MSLGYEHPRFYCASHSQFYTVHVPQERYGISRCHSVMVILYNVQEFSTARNLPSNYWVNKQHVASLQSLSAIASIHSSVEEVN